jgi:hypothetical protein
MRNPYKILAEKYTPSNLQKVEGKYIYFIQDDELFQLNPYKQIVSPGVKIMFLAPNWKKATVMQGEDVRDVLGVQLSPEDLRNWYIIDKNAAPSDHTFEVYIGY